MACMYSNQACKYLNFDNCTLFIYYVHIIYIFFIIIYILFIYYLYIIYILFIYYLYIIYILFNTYHYIIFIDINAIVGVSKIFKIPHSPPFFPVNSRILIQLQ